VHYGRLCPALKRRDDRHVLVHANHHSHRNGVHSIFGAQFPSRQRHDGHPDLRVDVLIAQ
jgi:hypothetical protein